MQHNGCFRVTALGMPPNESRDESMTSAKVGCGHLIFIEILANASVIRSRHDP